MKKTLLISLLLCVLTTCLSFAQDTDSTQIANSKQKSCNSIDTKINQYFAPLSDWLSSYIFFEVPPFRKKQVLKKDKEGNFVLDKQGKYKYEKGENGKVLYESPCASIVLLYYVVIDPCNQ